MLAEASDFDLSSALDLVSRMRERGLRPNVLVICPAGSCQAIARRMAAAANRPLHLRAVPGELALPAGTAGTLILNDVAALTRKQQAALLEWLDARRGPI